MKNALLSSFARSYLPETFRETKQVCEQGLLVKEKNGIEKDTVIIWDEYQALNIYSLLGYAIGEKVASYAGILEPKDRGDAFSTLRHFFVLCLGCGTDGRINATPRRLGLLRMADACAIGGLIASSRLKHDVAGHGNLRRVERLHQPVEMLIGDGPEKFHGIYMKARDVITPGDRLD